MILRIAAEGFELSEELNKYVHTKLDALDKYIARRDRPTTLVTVALRETDGAVPQRTCDLMVKLRREELRVRETTQHMYAALDIAAADMQQQLKQLRRRNPGPVRGYVRRTTKRPPVDSEK